MEKKAPRSFSWQFKEEVAKKMLSGQSGTALSRELSVSRSKIYKWRDQYRAGGVTLWRNAPGRLEGGTSDVSAESLRQTEARPENRVAELAGC